MQVTQPEPGVVGGFIPPKALPYWLLSGDQPKQKLVFRA